MQHDMTLDIAAEEQELKVTEITGSQAQKTRMLQMGLTPGTSLRILRKAPLADPVEIRVRGTHMVLRRDECQNIKVAGAQ